MMSGNLRGRRLSLVKDTFEAVGRFKKGDISQDELNNLEMCACPGAGSCQGLYTANSMACVTEALAGASKLTRGSGDRMLVFKARERADVRVGLLVADEEIRKNNIARAEQKTPEAPKAESNIFRDALIKAAVGAVADTLKEAAQKKLDGVAAGASGTPTGATTNTTTKLCNYLNTPLPCDEYARRVARDKEYRRLEAEQHERFEKSNRESRDRFRTN